MRFSLASIPNVSPTAVALLLNAPSPQFYLPAVLKVTKYNSNGQANPETDSSSNRWVRIDSTVVFSNSISVAGLINVDLTSQISAIMSAKGAVNRLSFGLLSNKYMTFSDSSDLTDPPKLQFTFPDEGAVLWGIF